MELTKATSKDYEELLRMAGEAFAGPEGPLDFRRQYPKLYSPQNDTTGSHYIVRDNGSIVAAAGSFANTMEVLGKSLSIRGIGTVAVSAAARGKGYMQLLMQKAMEDMRTEGVDFAFLGGDRQRYEYFSFTPAGICARFHLGIWNTSHLLGRGFHGGHTFSPLSAGDGQALDLFYSWYVRKEARVYRSRQLFYDTLRSNRCTPVAVCREEKTVGYLVCSEDRGTLCEIALEQPGQLLPVLHDYMLANQLKECFVEKVPLCEQEIIRTLSLTADSYRLTTCENFAILRFAPVVEAFLLLAARLRPLADGCLSIRVDTGEQFSITVTGGIPSVAPCSGAPDLSLPYLTAVQLFFACGMAAGSFGVSLPAFAYNWFPLPLFLTKPDNV